MTDLLRKFEPSDVIALVSLLVALCSLIAVEVRAELARRATDRRERQRQAGEAVGPVSAMLHDTHPDVLALNVSARTLDHRQRIEEHWRSVVRGPLLSVVTGYPDEQVRDLARDLARQVNLALRIGYERALDILNSRDSAWSHQEARDAQQRALDLADRTAAPIRGDKAELATAKGTPV